MEGKYFFNGKDISMNLSILLWKRVTFPFRMPWASFITQKLIKPYKIQKILFGRNLPAILQTAITKNKKTLKNNKTMFKKELLTKISGSFFM